MKVTTTIKNIKDFFIMNTAAFKDVHQSTKVVVREHASRFYLVLVQSFLPLSNVKMRKWHFWNIHEKLQSICMMSSSCLYGWDLIAISIMAVHMTVAVMVYYTFECVHRKCNYAKNLRYTHSLRFTCIWQENFSNDI